MRVNQFKQEDDAVSPVIGVILMVAITVILAAVIASFVLGLGDQADDIAPTTSFSFDYDGDADTVTITHDGGNTVEAGEIVVRGDGINDADTRFHELSGEFDEGSQVSSGQSVTVNVDPDYSIDVVWDPQPSDESSILASDDGPEA